MGHTKENKDVDLFFDPKPLTEKDQQMISDFIKADKEKRERKNPSKVKHSDKVIRE